jgi:hypothetical protein
MVKHVLPVLAFLMGLAVAVAVVIAISTSIRTNDAVERLLVRQAESLCAIAQEAESPQIRTQFKALCVEAKADARVGVVAP